MQEIDLIIKNYYDGKAYTEPFPMRLIANLSYGQTALNGGSWSGYIDLTNIEQVKWFEGYLFR
jgi:hypothetical protein